MKYSVGSTESSDLKIVIDSEVTSVQIFNMVPAIPDELVQTVITSLLQEYDLLRFTPTVWFHGGNEWVIRSRCEALLALMTEEQVVVGGACGE